MNQLILGVSEEHEALEIIKLKVNGVVERE